ncbi:MAG: hypothetical protein ACLFU2_11625 [Opitutales bacterium]
MIGYLLAALAVLVAIGAVYYFNRAKPAPARTDWGKHPGKAGDHGEPVQDEVPADREASPNEAAKQTDPPRPRP